MHSLWFLTPVWLIFILFEWVNHLSDWFALRLATFAGNLLPHLTDTVYKTQSDSQSALQQLFLQNCAQKWGRWKVAELVINSSTTLGESGQFWRNGIKSVDLRRNKIWPQRHCPLNFLVIKQMGKKEAKEKEKYVKLRGKYFPIYLKSSEISLTDLQVVLHIKYFISLNQLDTARNIGTACILWRQQPIEEITSTKNSLPDYI